MCIAPITIPNPSFAPRFVNANAVSIRDNITKFSALHQPLFSSLQVPCGHCPQCRKIRTLSVIQRFEEHSKNRWTLFCTATYSNDALPVYSCRLEDGSMWSIPYPDFRDFRLMIKRIRKSNLVSRPFTYWCTSEYGNDDKHGKHSSKHRPHFHYFIFFDRLPSDTLFDAYALEREFESAFLQEWRRNLSASTKSPEWLPLSVFIKATKYRRGTYDVHLVESRSDSPEESPIFYATSYALAGNSWEDKILHYAYNNMDVDTYSQFRKLFKTKYTCSLFFGFDLSKPETIQYIRECIDFSLRNKKFPVYIVKRSGKTFPLARYYRSKFMTISDKLQFLLKNPEDLFFTEEGEALCSHVRTKGSIDDYIEHDRQLAQYDRITKLIESHSL